MVSVSPIAVMEMSSGFTPGSDASTTYPCWSRKLRCVVQHAQSHTRQHASKLIDTPIVSVSSPAPPLYSIWQVSHDRLSECALILTQASQSSRSTRTAQAP